MTVADPDDGWPDPRKRPPGGDVGSVLGDRAAEERSLAGPPASPAPQGHPYLTLVLVGPLVLASLLAVGLLLSGAWATLLASPMRLFLIVLGILFPIATFLVFHRRRRGAHAPRPS